MGGYPVDRSKPGKLVEKVAEIYNSHDQFSICITPEGTRKYAAEWKTGFHKIAMAVKAPVVMVAFDYRTKTVVIAPPFTPSEDTQGDIEKIKAWYRQFEGKIPEFGVK